MRTFTADWVFPVSSPPIKNGVVAVDDKGVIVEVAEGKGQGSGKVEKFEGIITPGFVNAHCHLELSHLKGQVSERKGLTGFISELVPKRDTFSMERIKKTIENAEAEMIRNGIVAVGDISNTDHSFEQKGKKNLLYHTFIEVFDLSEDKAKEKFLEGKLLSTKLDKLPHSIVPHAPYTVSGKLMEQIDSLKQSVISIHNQETTSENELFESGTGPLAELMQKFGVDVDVKKREKNSLLFTLARTMETARVLLVHNTYTSKQDIEFIKQYSGVDSAEVSLCLCPNANLYIENRLPDILLFIKEGMKICLGTDSYASNWNLSILEEMKTISKHFPQIPFETLLQWATKNGAEVLGFDQLGMIEKGKKPGLNLISGIDLQKGMISSDALIRKVV